MWLLFTASLALTLVLLEWVPVTASFYHSLPVISLLDGLGGPWPTVAATLVVGSVVGSTYLVLWLLGSAINFLFPRRFEDFTRQLSEGTGMRSLLLCVLVLVPLMLAMSTYLGHANPLTWGLGVLMVISAAFALRPFSTWLQLVPALRDAPNRVGARDDPWSPIPLEPPAPIIGPPPAGNAALPTAVERIAGDDAAWLTLQF